MGQYLAEPKTNKTISQGKSTKLKIKYTLCEMQGWRRGMEDAAICQVDIGDGNSLFAIFDGHGGPQVSHLVKIKYIEILKSLKPYRDRKYEDALVETARIIDEYIGSAEGQKQLRSLRQANDNIFIKPKKGPRKKLGSYHGEIGKLVKQADKEKQNKKSLKQQVKNNDDPWQIYLNQKVGCTGNVVLITHQKIYVANIGDSRSILCRNLYECITLSKDHKPTDPQEQARIQKAGGIVKDTRINEGLNLSRCFGDFAYKKNNQLGISEQMVIAIPDIKIVYRRKEDNYIMLACDGVFQKYSKDQFLVGRISNELRTKASPPQVLSRLFDSLLAKDTRELLGCDNMSAILIQFIN